nr:transposase DNA-binding-containing protein [Leptospira borgpetersenii]
MLFVNQDWSSTKAAYRFLSNNRISEKEKLGGHFLVNTRKM